MAQKLQLEDVIQDVNMSGAFLTFLRASYMSVSYELWMEIVKYETACVDDESRREVYRAVMERFFVKGCPDPMSLPKLITHSITKWYDKEDKENLPLDLFCQAKEELWMLLCWTCLPAFQLSEAYKDFESGKVDSVKTGFSRNKAENFFGQSITGPLVRSELVTHFGSTTTKSYGEQKRRLKQELEYQKDKKMDMGDVVMQARKGGLFKRIDLDEIAEQKGMTGTDSSTGSQRTTNKSKGKRSKGKSYPGKKTKKITKFHPVYGEVQVEVTDDEAEDDLEDDLLQSNVEMPETETEMKSGHKDEKARKEKGGGNGQAVGLWE
eukprot:CAMPEP_0201521038 /NCGR_PEP_ID=MMETSP0161_2-20130828/13902_1 /ASSEMBLY_ACC=CAM_ASM_000251 /TAXON_ID=180227 /ORGANISM="Neoparamoeba aestuarina, Strain SoJaBio B1-5/56/2" /LENGTH=321 /DNA_ID=CAMNT_0047919593 /DNA_START=70 /DNA_END=1032 /DNA_ORIENTATION=-